MKEKFDLPEKYDSVFHIFVLGDVGHSPRMLNHSLMLQKNNRTVSLIGMLDSENVDLNGIFFYKLYSFFGEFASCSGKYVSLILIISKVIFLTLQIFFYCTFWIKSGDKIIIQNPPAIPVLLVLYLVRFFKSFKVYLDWHNFGYTLLALTHGRDSFLVKFTER